MIIIIVFLLFLSFDTTHDSNPPEEFQTPPQLVPQKLCPKHIYPIQFISKIHRVLSLLLLRKRAASYNQSCPFYCYDFKITSGKTKLSWNPQIIEAETWEETWMVQAMNMVMADPPVILSAVF